MSSKEVIKRLKADGWFEVLPRTAGSHKHYHHPTKPGRVTVQDPEKDIPLGTLKSIERQSSIKMR